MKKEYIFLKETKLTNNCPECYATDGMALTFKQEKIQSNLFVKTTKKVVDHIQCKKCGSDIFAGMWTQDIERVYSYHKKTITPKSQAIKFTGAFYMLAIAIVLIVIAGYMYFIHPEALGL